MNVKHELVETSPSTTQQTIHHHPDQNMLAEYAAGTLGFSTAVSVSAHLNYCEKCRETVKTLESIGGTLLEQLETDNVTVDDNCFDAVLSRIDQEIPSSPKAFAKAASNDNSATDNNDLPNVVKRLIPQQQNYVEWKRIGLSLFTASLDKLDNKHDISLHRIQAGSSVFEHDHHGEEITLVLKGSFSDEDGMYQQGDFIVKQPGDTHRPMAAKNEDCVCLVVQEAPVKFTGVFSRWLNPLLKKS